MVRTESTIARVRAAMQQQRRAAAKMAAKRPQRMTPVAASARTTAPRTTR